MYKLLLCLLLIVFQMWMLALQLDEEKSMHLLFELKHGVNRATHAASMQLNESLLSQGIWAIDEQRAAETAELVLRENLRLDESGQPLPGSLFRSGVQIPVFEIINENHTFPYRYMNVDYGYDVTLDRPGVVMIVQAEYPRIFRVVEPIVWTIKGTSELYTP